MSGCEAPKFCASDGYHAAEMALLVYLDWPAVEERLVRLGYPLFKSFEVDDTQAFVAANSKEVVYCFRGTDSVGDWLSNLDARTVSVSPEGFYRQQRVHEGFYDAMMKVGPEVLKQVQLWMLTRHAEGGFPKKLTGVGHSLGAACCVHFSKLLACDLNPTVWLFGCPRSGNKEFAREYNFSPLGNRTFRVVNENDAVTRVPKLFRLKRLGRFSRVNWSIPVLFNWQHVGRFYYVDWRGRLSQRPSARLRLCNQIVGRTIAWYKSHDWHDGITRHLMGGDHGYLNAMSNLL